MSLILGLALATAHAGALPDGITPVVAPTDAPSQYARWAKDNGKNGSLACASIWTADVLLCFRKTEGTLRRWVLTQDLRTLNLTLSDLVEMAKADAATRIDQRERKRIDGMSESYWQLRDASGWSAVAMLDPRALTAATKSPTPLYVAFPTQQVSIAWPSGNPDLDRIMLVGVREMYEQMPNPVSPAAHLWTGDEWRRGGEAVKTDDGSTEEKGSGADGTRTHDL